MSYLADTHALLWYVREPERVSRKAWALLESPEEPVFFSMASVWEIAIKLSLGKLKIDATVGEFVQAQVRNGFQLLPIQVQHVARVAELPLEHRDPFDRLIIAQALVSGLEIITADPAFDRYPVGTIW